MNAAQFNTRFRELVAQPLASLGFRPTGRHLFLRQEVGEVVLLRCDGGVLALLQIAQFIVCIRHTFLRNLERQLPTGISSEPNDYPFKLRLLQFSALSSWHYEPINLGVRRYDEIDYGKLKSVDAPLKEMADVLGAHASNWIALLTPETALSQIRQFGQNAYCEKIWIKDYEQFLSGGRKAS